jgi:hypothetical protein
MNLRHDLPENYYFRGGGDTIATPLGLCVLCAAVILILVLPRRYVVLSFLAAGLLLPMTLNVAVFGLNFMTYRLLLLAGWLRYLVRRDFAVPQWNVLDRAVLLWALANAAAYVLLWGEAGAVINRLGFLYNALGAYFLLRLTIHDKTEIVRVIKLLAVITILVAPLMLREHFTGHNLFSLMGANELSEIREGRVRAQGPLSHPIIAGTVGATLIPLFVGLWQYERRSRAIATLGIAAACVMVFACSSSTPVLSIAAAIGVLIMWPARKNLKVIRWGAISFLILAQLCMKVPVWFLMSKASAVLGGSGWHRALLIDNFVHNFGDWWLVGTRSNADWGWDMWDVDNAFVAAGQGGGLVTFILYLAIFVYAYKFIGAARKRAELVARDARLMWALGSALFATTVAFFGITFFDQSFLLWYGLLSMIAAAATYPAGDKIAQLAASPSTKNSPRVKKMFRAQPAAAIVPLRLWHHEL